MRYAQSVNGIVDLVGGEEVGLTCEKTEPNVYVREDIDGIVQIGWLWDSVTETFVKPPEPPEPPTDPLVEIEELKARVRITERAAIENSEANQGLLELLIEMEVI